MNKLRFDPPCLDRLRRRTRDGFTLVELLIVIGIVLLLMSLALTVTTQVRGQARAVECASHLRQIGVALTHTRLHGPAQSYPAASAWTKVVRDFTGADRILMCPSSTVAVNESPDFVTPTFSYKPNTNKGHPQSWTQVSPDKYIATIVYQKNKPEYATIEFVRISGNQWQARPTRIDPKKPYGGPPIDIETGLVTLADVQVGQSYLFTSGISSSHYGYNIALASARTPKPDRVMVMDYLKTTIDYDGLNNNDDVPAQDLLGRHLKPPRVQVLFVDGSVSMRTISDLQPSTGVYATK